MRTCDYLIIGAGVIGTSVAYNLAAQGAKNILVLEAEPVIGMGSTSRSAAGVRQQFSSDINVQVCKRSVELMEHFEEVHGQEIEFRQVGYLFLLNSAEQETAFRASLEMWQGHGLPVEWLTPDEIARRHEFLRTDDLVGGTFCPTDGAVDPSALNYGFYKSSIGHGVEYSFRTEATRLEYNGSTWTVTTNNDTIETARVINCAGPALKRVGERAGIDLPADPVRRHCFTTDVIGGGSLFNIPMCVDMRTGLYFRGESGGLLLGLANKNEPAGWNMNVDYDLLEDIADAFLHRAPSLEDISIRKGWAGLYSVTPDHQAIIGPVDGYEGFYVVGGFSGHGIMQSAAVGESFARYLLTGTYGPVDLTPLELKRFAAGAVTAEQNVI